MTTVAILGAGRGLGAAVARRFGRAGFAVGLVSRHQGHLDALAAELGQDDVQAQGFTADVRVPATIATALQQVSEALGPIEVLQYSPLPEQAFMRPVLETTAADLRGAVDFSIHGSVAAVEQVLPGMRSLGGGATPSILFVNGDAAVRPDRTRTGTSVAFAGQAAYAELLHEVLGEEGIYVGQLIIGGQIIEGDPEKDPDALAERLWELHTGRDTFRIQVGVD
ncbi:SDR family NAD(P)-dependent oxidoreductase [Marmoricola sp. URHB0036]|uniref:SDR family NAD(P)-dependent oxidoreductase n=1 Tax=Marmoricola sp. URHB0036 TaxID=1298863 RepID=UPI00041F826E|nr:SDR family NAD(P)-dependent oxidoreductase [Marmoricola sp. URHB0036]